MSRFRCAFSYYGGKSMLAHLYPSPRHDVVVEPFAGGASYSLRHHERQVVINDVDDRVVAIWRFLTSPSAGDMVERYVPARAECGAKVSDMVPDDAPPGLVWLLRAECNRGTLGTRQTSNVVTAFGVTTWPQLRGRLMHWIPRVSHWRVEQLDYRQLAIDGPATWFVDPPYSNQAGSLYRHPLADFDELAGWVRSRQGQVIVCENDGAAWLPFTPLTAVRRGVRSKTRARATTGEVVFLQENGTPAPELQ